MKIRIILYIITPLLILAGCKPNVPEGFISQSDMEDIIYDYCIAQGVVATDGKDYEKKKTDLYLYKKSILDKYEVTEADFDSSMVYYMSHSKLLYKIYDNVTERLSNDAVAMGAAVTDLDKFGNINASGDTTNIWKDRSTVVLSQFPPYNKLSFHIKADSSYHEGDRLILDFENKFIYQDGSRMGVAFLSVRYDNDSIVSQKTFLTSTGSMSVEIPSCKGRTIKDIRGFFYHMKKAEDTMSTLRLLALSKIRLIRFHNTTVSAADSLNVARPSKIDTLPQRKISDEQTKDSSLNGEDRQQAF